MREYEVRKEIRRGDDKIKDERIRERSYREWREKE